jgi:hypothetical protein
MDLMNLTDSEFEMIIEGLDALKGKDFAVDLMGIMFKGLGKPKEQMTLEEKKEADLKEEKEALDQEIKKAERKEVAKKIDVVKAKLILMQAQRSV